VVGERGLEALTNPDAPSGALALRRGVREVGPAVLAVTLGQAIYDGWRKLVAPLGATMAVEQCRSRDGERSATGSLRCKPDSR
jgi:hypothetical protein